MLSKWHYWSPMTSCPSLQRCAQHTAVNTHQIKEQNLWCRLLRSHVTLNGALLWLRRLQALQRPPRMPVLLLHVTHPASVQCTTACYPHFQVALGHCIVHVCPGCT